ncbi:MAG: thioredoxin domain-containing protein [Rhabdochlamydiaceae bacterium]
MPDKVVELEKKNKPNRLLNETSRYLQQHAYNPVDWYPWGDDAFQRAKQENKPIFLSIGYSSCHWCHVMAHESFEDRDIAELLNESFVCIKLDREERPDVDELYMKAVMSMTGSGGWPLNVFLTPNLEPFFGGTYFPPSPRYGMPSFANVIKNISQSWKSDRKKINASANELKVALREIYDFRKEQNPIIDDSVFQECFIALAGSFDENFGGFGDSPKFPIASNLFFLTRYHRMKPLKSKLALNIVTRTLDSMMRGGIHDHVGGGFHRYSTDRYWLVPHFEKMLYDNALLLQAYLEAYLVTKNEDYAKLVNETLSWVLREMRSPKGGFYSAQDADTIAGEGAYYVWSKQEVKEALSRDTEMSEKSEIITRFFSITNEGNFENAKTILTTKPGSLLAQEFGMKQDELDAIIDRAKKLMLDSRNQRPKPLTDDKIQTSWNGLMISAMSKAYEALGVATYLEGAIAAAELILNALTIENGHPKLFRSLTQGEPKGNGVLEDYSFFINGLIDLYEASFEPKYLEKAISLCETMLIGFHDSNGGGFYQTSGNATDLIARAKDAFDGATPSGNSVAALACSRLAEFTTRTDFKEAAKDTFEAFWRIIKDQPSAFTEMLVALQFFLGNASEIVVSGSLESKETRNLLNTLRSEFLPNSVLLLADRRLENISPLVSDRIPLASEQPRVFVCTNFACKLPSTNSQQLIQALRE